ncbi:MAG TPA: hypothetical protein VFZ34_12990 [Blastocatellia bacterium]|nr:hypothetical protein [Blastocatellia bacterium]
MFGLETPELVIVLCILLLLFGVNRLRNQFKNGGGPFGDTKPGFEFQPINAPASVISHCPKCGAATKGFYENCPVCGEKIGERLAVVKTL